MNSYVEEVYSMLMEGQKEWAESEMESDKPAEVFDAHPISAMKIADVDLPAEASETINITDTWKPEWQRGVQVPVNPPTDFPQTVVKIVDLPVDRKRPKFVMPQDFLRCSKDSGEGEAEASAVSYVRVRLEEMFAGVCRYDIDQLDHAWIAVVNEERKCLRQRLVEEAMVEHVVEALEVLTHDKLQEAQRQVKDDGKGLEYDETVLCDVCKEPDGEDGNEMVFCDGCDVCVHQACYGILNIPDGIWLCRPCSLGFKASCTLCPKAGGALKPARDGARWCHVSCALWIPEVGFGDVEKMEPITRLTDIPPARWSLLCCVCRQRVGACIQCAVKSCKTAFHVTCAHQQGLTMQQILTGDDVRMMAFCPRHSNPPKTVGAAKGVGNSSLTDAEPESAPVSAGRQSVELDASFHGLVSLDELRAHLTANSHLIPQDICQLVHDYWKLKRRASGNVPLLKVGERPPVIDEEHARLVARMQMFITLRHDLERARNLCYMILRREKMKRSRFRAHESLVKSVCRQVKKAAKSMTPGELEEMADLPFLPDDIYDCGPTFAARSLVYARACPEQELLTRQELARLQETAPPKGKTAARPPVPPPKATVGAAQENAVEWKGTPLREAVPKAKPGRKSGGKTTLKRKRPIHETQATGDRADCSWSKGETTEDEQDDEDFDTTTEWVSVDDLLGSVSPIDRIPRDQLLVSHDIRERLRGGLARREYRGLIRSVGAANSPGSGAGPSNPKNIFDRLLSSQRQESI